LVSEAMLRHDGLAVSPDHFLSCLSFAAHAHIRREDEAAPLSQPDSGRDSPIDVIPVYFLGRRTQSARLSPESPATTDARAPSPKSRAHCSPRCWPLDALHCQPVRLIGAVM